MAQRQEIQYVRYYSVGSEAKKIQHQEKRNDSAKTVISAPEHVILIDPVALIGTIVAIALLVCMLIGIYQLAAVNHRIMEVNACVSSLKTQNEKLKIDYNQSYTIDEVEAAAEAMGLIPRDQAQRISITIPEPAAAEQPGILQRIIMEFQELFA